MSMVVGLFPVIGLPFPFVSYGGSFMVSCFIMIAIINNIIHNDLLLDYFFAKLFVNYNNEKFSYYTQ